MEELLHETNRIQEELEEDSDICNHPISGEVVEKRSGIKSSLVQMAKARKSEGRHSPDKAPRQSLPKFMEKRLSLQSLDSTEPKTPESAPIAAVESDLYEKK